MKMEVLPPLKKKAINRAKGKQKSANVVTIDSQSQSPAMEKPTDDAVEKQMTSLVHYSAILYEIQYCARVDEAKGIRDRMMAIAVYARQAQNYDVEKKAAEIRLRAEVRAGELLKTVERAKPGQAGGGTDGKGVRPSVAPTLSDLGVTKAQSATWQRLADIPEQEREEYIAAPEQIPSASGLLALHEAKSTVDAQAVTAAVPNGPRKKVLLNVNNLRLADLCQAEESRYTLNAIQVTREETVVTNGHYLVRVTLPKTNGDYPNVEGWPTDSGEWSELLIPRATAIDALKNVRRKQHIPILNNAVLFKSDDGRVSIGTTALDRNDGMTAQMVDGKQYGRFPNWKAVMPKQTPRFTITLNADLLARLAKNASEFMADERQKPLRIQFTDADSALRMDCRNNEGQQWTGLLMPLRDGAYRNDYEPDRVPNQSKDVPTVAEIDKQETAQ